jgi:hypothetical protein
MALEYDDTHEMGGLRRCGAGDETAAERRGEPSDTKP